MEDLKLEIEKLEKEIELEKSFDEHSEELSFMYYQLNELKKELKEKGE
jgi:hypothetical protein